VNTVAFSDDSHIPRTHEVSLEIRHLEQAFIDEEFNIDVKIIVNDERPIQASLSVFLHPEEEDDGEDIYIR
jgi:hypothetical protein